MPSPNASPAATRLLALALLAMTPASQFAHAGSFAFVTNQNSSDLSVIDLEKQREIRRIDVPGKPAGIALAPAHGAFFTVSPDDKTIRRFSISDCVLEATAALPGGPTGIAVDETSGRIFVSDWYNARIQVLGTEELELQAELQTGSAPAGLVVSRDAAWLASADRDAHQVSFFALPDLSPLGAITVGIRPFGMAQDPMGRLHVANVGSNDITVIDPRSRTVVATVPVGERPYGIGFAGGRAFSTDQYADTVTAYDLTNFSRIDVVDVGEYPEGIEAALGGSAIAVANWFSNTLSLIDATSLEMLAEIETGDGPRAFGRFVLETQTETSPCQ
ncbi:YncE family protein [Roseibium sp.]|uniref:YncE family protein n=1 Tax=Roseibium sp. TaxID=1936156 RepID=UPI003A97E066